MHHPMKYKKPLIITLLACCTLNAAQAQFSNLVTRATMSNYVAQYFASMLASNSIISFRTPAFYLTTNAFPSATNQFDCSLQAQIANSPSATSLTGFANLSSNSFAQHFLLFTNSENTNWQFTLNSAGATTTDGLRQWYVTNHTVARARIEIWPNTWTNLTFEHSW